MTDVGVSQQLAELINERAVVDLSLPLSEELPCTWPGHMPFRATTWSWFTDRDGPQPVHPATGGTYQTRWLVIDEHAGTHIDAPRHFIPPAGSGLPNAGPYGAVGVDRLGVLCSSGPAAVVDASALTGAGPNGGGPRITPAHLDAFEAEHGRIRAGEVVLLRTDWDERYHPAPEGARYGENALVTRTEPGWPAPTAEAIGRLYDRGVRCVGTDGLSIGPADNGAPTHLAGLSRGMVFVEGLTGLRQLPARGAWFLFLPIKLVDGSGAPGRAIAVLP